jgi:hypothetical protein
MDIAEQNPSIVSEGFPNFFFILVGVLFVEFLFLSQFILFFMVPKELFAVFSDLSIEALCYQPEGRGLDSR